MSEEKPAYSMLIEIRKWGFRRSFYKNHLGEKSYADIPILYSCYQSGQRLGFNLQRDKLRKQNLLTSYKK